MLREIRGYMSGKYGAMDHRALLNTGRGMARGAHRMEINEHGGMVGADMGRQDKSQRG